MSLPAFAIKRPVTTVMLTLIVVILGLMAFVNLRQELMPEMDLGIAIVFASYDGAGPEEIENLVTRPLENALSTVSNLRNMTTTSSAGTSIIVLEFEDGTDMDYAALNMRENIDMFRPLFPSGLEPRVMQIDPSMMQSFVVGVTGDYDMVRLKNVVEDQIVRRIERLEGVGSVSISGGVEREISVELNPTQLAGHGITAMQVAGMLAQENVNRPGGALIQGETELQVRTVNEFQSVQEIENLPIMTPTGAVIRLTNVARVVDGFREVTSYSVINGRQGVTLSITQQSTANTVEVGERIHRELQLLQQEFPHLEFTVISDTSHFIVTALSNVWVTVFQATGLAMLVLLLFLGNIRSPLIIGVSIPVSLVASLALMYFADMTLNMVSLNALVIGVGLLIDNAIVVLESIYRYINQGLEPKEAARKGAQEVGLAVTAATLTTIAVFVPVLFVTGIAGAMFGQLGLVLSFTLLSSLVVAMTFVPMACSKFLKPQPDSQKGGTPFRKFWLAWNRSYGRFEDRYSRVLRWSLGHKAVVIVLFLVFLLGSGSIIGMMGMEFMGSMDQGQVNISVSAPRGGLLDEISELTETALSRISDMEEIENISVTVGSGGGLAAMFGGGSTNNSSIFIQLTPRDGRRTVDAVMEDMRNRIHPLPGAEVTVTSSDGMGGGMGGGGNTVSFSLFGDDMGLLAYTGDDIVQLISTLPTIRNAESSLQAGYPQAQVAVDRQRASRYGLQASAIASTVQMAIAGTTVTQYRVGGTEVDVVMRYQPERLVHITDLQNLMLSTPMGTSIPLSEVADIVIEQGPASITKQNQRPYITISAEFIDTDLNSVTQEISALLEDYVFMGGITWEFGGAFEMMMESFVALGWALLLGFVLLYMVMASQFESLAYPSTILFSIPIAWTAGLFGIFIMGENISIVSFIGLILLMGIVTNNGIVLVDYINTKRRDGLVTFEAIIFAAKVRLRPILMTTITTVVGLMPMMLATGEGAEMQQPLGAIIVFGLSFSTMITLILIPVLYLILHNIRKRIFSMGT
ncbi:MAG: efflux RND transporter permease subunit [Defluviitaleaceae bacterium]|nr:efflux RND transporter permease subunit [Defluviitaleaceae bacterium]